MTDVSVSSGFGSGFPFFYRSVNILSKPLPSFSDKPISRKKNITFGFRGWELIIVYVVITLSFNLSFIVSFSASFSVSFSASFIVSLASLFLLLSTGSTNSTSSTSILFYSSCVPLRTSYQTRRMFMGQIRKQFDWVNHNIIEICLMVA